MKTYQFRKKGGNLERLTAVQIIQYFQNKEQNLIKNRESKAVLDECHRAIEKWQMRLAWEKFHETSISVGV